jgi:hypothetical protein
MFQTAQAGLLRFAGQSGDPDAGLRFDPFCCDPQSRQARTEAQDDTAHAGVTEEEIAPLADDDEREGMLVGKSAEALDLGDGLGLDEEIGGTADAPGAVIRQGGGKGTETNIAPGEFCKEGGRGGVGHGQAAIVNKKRGARC